MNVESTTNTSVNNSFNTPVEQKTLDSTESTKPKAEAENLIVTDNIDTVEISDEGLVALSGDQNGNNPK